MNPQTNAATHEARKFLKARELSRRLGICSKTLARWAAAGKISRFKHGERLVFFDEQEVIAFVESGRMHAAPVTN